MYGGLCPPHGKQTFFKGSLRQWPDFSCLPRLALCQGSTGTICFNSCNNSERSGFVASSQLTEEETDSEISFRTQGPKSLTTVILLSVHCGPSGSGLDAARGQNYLHWRGPPGPHLALLIHVRRQRTQGPPKTHTGRHSKGSREGTDSYTGSMLKRWAPMTVAERWRVQVGGRKPEKNKVLSEAVEKIRQARVVFRGPASASDPGSMPSTSAHQLDDLEKVTSSLCVSFTPWQGAERPVNRWW